MRYHSYFNTAVVLIRSYDGSLPLTHFLKQYFAEHKKHGSKDRKLIGHLCYCYYRAGHAFEDISVEERLKAALFLCSDIRKEWAILYEDNWLAGCSDDLSQRITFLKKIYPSFNPAAIFPWEKELSKGIDHQAFALSHCIQPDLFLRIRPGYSNAVKQVLEKENIVFAETIPGCLSLPNSSKVDRLLALDKEVVIQDKNSQRVGALMKRIGNNRSGKLSVWDCCAASGGKSLLAIDELGDIDLTVSDLRPSILQNLKERFQRAGVQHFRSIISDLSRPGFRISGSPFDLVICDAPCSGSGTWGRTPEQLYFFSDEKIEAYSGLQQKILSNILPHITDGGHLLYITCSVFEKENEAQVNRLLQQGGFLLVEMNLYEGYTGKADTMFAALLKKG